MRFINQGKTSKYIVQRVWPNKTLETGYQICKESDVDFYLSFKTKGDHARLRFNFQLWKFMFEFNVCDDRHWNYEADRFYLQGEEPVFEGYPHE